MKVLAAIVCALAVSAVHAQTPAFEAASIRPSRADQNSTRFKLSGGRLSAENCTLTFIIQRAYGLRDFQISGGPSWTDDGAGDRFDIEAKAVASTSDQDLKLMAQTLLSDRFHLKAHRETRLVPVWALTIAKGGPRLKAAKAGEPAAIGSSPGNIEATNAPISALIDENSSKVDRPIIDKTGLTGNFTFTLLWTPDKQEYINPGMGSIFTAIQEQLGLKLESQKAPFEILVIDSIERPSAN